MPGPVAEEQLPAAGFKMVRARFSAGRARLRHDLDNCGALSAHGRRPCHRGIPEGTDTSAAAFQAMTLPPSYQTVSSMPCCYPVDLNVWSGRVLIDRLLRYVDTVHELRGIQNLSPQPVKAWQDCSGLVCFMPIMK